ncbi:MAG: wax ester/triacylglycerol synthase family O-acyltransferase [Betaproteobacteria bacterium]|nr:wax ester/triacylglycerol synthase family O-acyltransferase [Betaproteobacteria bacterium]
MSEARLNPLDASWIITESRAAPNHVGGLLQFRLPDNAPKDVLQRMMRDFRNHKTFVSPWNRRLKHAFNMNPMPVWVEDDDIDLEYHVRHSALPWPGGERELGELVGRLQSTPIDLTRPPWECTIIEGLAGRRFALFIKMHHSLIDGVSGMKLLQRGMSADRAKSLKMPPFWASGAPAADGATKGARPEAAPSFANAIGAAVEALRGQARTVPQLALAFGKIFRRVGQSEDGLAVPFDSPRSVLNGRVREKRRFATQQFPMERLRAVAAAADCTLNDVVLGLCSGALRRFLRQRHALPEKTLTAGIPVSVRLKDDEGAGNAISFIVARLGTDISDPAERLEAIKASVRHAKEHVQSLPRQAMTQYTMVLMAPTVLTMLTGTGGRIRPMFNITISNVPGPDKPLYFRGAELLAIYPASIVTHGQALNITCQSYAGTMNFGFTGCHASVPHLQRLAVYAEKALQELEAAVGGGGKSAKRVRGTAARGTARKSTRKTAARTPGTPPRPAPRRRKRVAAAKPRRGASLA